MQIEKSLEVKKHIQTDKKEINNENNYAWIFLLA